MLLKDIDQFHKFSRVFSSKLILAGEYTVIDGGSSLALPFAKFQAKLVEDRLRPPSYDWTSYIDYLVEINLPFKAETISQLKVGGLHFDSTIPEGYGCGSSGALVAAFAERLELQYDDDYDLKKKLGIMESFFHGRSSGIDPYVIYKNCPVKTFNGVIDVTGIQKQLLEHVYLYDTKQARSTSKLVDTFHNTIKPSKVTEVRMLCNFNDELVSLLTEGGEIGQFIDCWKQISKLQFDIFKSITPPHAYDVWEEGIKEASHFVKMCGAGGGGFYYVYTESKEVVRKYDLMAVSPYV
jgi:mevalonate kinase